MLCAELFLRGAAENSFAWWQIFKLYPQLADVLFQVFQFDKNVLDAANDSLGKSNTFLSGGHATRLAAVAATGWRSDSFPVFFSSPDTYSSSSSRSTTRTPPTNLNGRSSSRQSCSISPSVPPMYKEARGGR